MKGFFFALFLTIVAGKAYAGCPGGICSLRNRETISSPPVKVVEQTFATSAAPANKVVVSEPVVSEPVVSEPVKAVGNCCKPVTVKNTCRHYRCRRCR